MADAEITADKSCRIVQLNDTAERLTGWRTQDAAGRPLHEVCCLIDPATGKRIWNVVERMLDGKPALLLDRRGKKVSVEGTASPRRGGDGAINGVTLKLGRAHVHHPGVIDRLKEAVFEIDPHGRLTFLNKAWEGIMLRRVEDSLGKSLTDFIHPEDAPRHFEKLRLAADAGHCRYELRLLLENGGTRWVEIYAESMCDASGSIKGYFGTLDDVTETRRTAQQLRFASSVFEHNLESIFIADRHYRIVSVNPAFCAITGYAPEEVEGRPMDMLRSRKHEDVMRESVKQCGNWRGEVWSRRKNGEIYPELLEINAVSDDSGQVTHYVGIALDITERKLAEEQIHQLAYFDTLTSLPNRLLLMDRLEMLINQSGREGRQFAVLSLDLDHFKTVNDTLGHSGADNLLQTVAQRLIACVREGDTVSRLGGDEFVVILSSLGRNEIGEVAQIAAFIAEKIRSALSDPFLLDGKEVLVTASLGISLYPSDARCAEDIIKSADTALFHAKSQGRNNYQFYSEKMNMLTLERISMQSDLRKAIEREELEVHYQPQVDIGTGLVTGMEALMRWKHPARGWIPPAQFIPLAEESGVIVQLGEWMMKTVCAQMKVWQMAGLLNETQRISVNVSPRQFREGDFSKMIEKILGETALSANRLELEMTESMLMQNTESTLDMLTHLKQLGVKLSLDDFGTGYSSLSYLKRFPLDVLKIDQSFVRDITADSNDAAIVAAIIAMARSLKLKVIAEGVETPDQFSHLKDQGCHGFQGFYFSEPLPGEGMTQLFQSTSLH